MREVFLFDSAKAQALNIKTDLHSRYRNLMIIWAVMFIITMFGILIYLFLNPDESYSVFNAVFIIYFALGIVFLIVRIYHKSLKPLNQIAYVKDNNDFYMITAVGKPNYATKRGVRGHYDVIGNMNSDYEAVEFMAESDNVLRVFDLHINNKQIEEDNLVIEISKLSDLSFNDDINKGFKVSYKNKDRTVNLEIKDVYPGLKNNMKI